MARQDSLRRINAKLGPVAPNAPQVVQQGTAVNVQLGQNELAQPVVLLTIGTLQCPLEPGIAVQLGNAMANAAYGALSHRLAQLEQGAIIRPSGLA